MMTTSPRTDTTAGEALTVVAVCFGWAILASLQAVASGFPAGHGFSDAGAAA